MKLLIPSVHRVELCCKPLMRLKMVSFGEVKCLSLALDLGIIKIDLITDHEIALGERLRQSLDRIECILPIDD